MPSAAAKRDIQPDPTVYPIEDGVGEGTLQRFISELLRILIERWLESRGKPAFVGADQFFYWEQYNPSECVAPDVYVLPGVPGLTEVGAWKVWESGLVPSFAFEVVSQDVDKDYLLAPIKYGRLGVEELIIFDPGYQESRSRVRWQVYRRTKRGLVLVEATDADRVRSKVLGCWLRAVGEGAGLRVRLGYGTSGATLLPTDMEARAQAEAERERAEAERRSMAEALEAERRARAELEAELARLRGEAPGSAKERAKSRKGQR